MIATREPTPNERRYMVLAAARRYPGARPAGVLLLLFAAGATAWVISGLVAGRGAPWRLVVIGVVVALLLGAELLVLSLGPSGKGAAVVAHGGPYRRTRERVGARSRVAHWIGEARVELPPGWARRLRPGRTVQAELGFLAASLGATPAFRGRGVWVLSLDGRHRVDAEVKLGLLQIRFPVSLVAAMVSTIVGASATAVMLLAQEGEGSPVGKLVSGVRRALELRDLRPGAGTVAVASALLTALLGLRGMWVLLRNHAILRRIRAGNPEPS